MSNRNTVLTAMLFAVLLCAPLSAVRAGPGEPLVQLLEERVKIEHRIADVLARKQTAYREWDELGLSELAQTIKQKTAEIEQMRAALADVCKKAVHSEAERQAQLLRCEEASAPVNRMVDENNDRRDKFNKLSAPIATELKQIIQEEEALAAQKQELEIRLARLPNDPKDKLAMRDSAMHIMDALNAKGENNRAAVEFMRDRIFELDNPNSVPAHEAYSYLLGLYAAEKILGGEKPVSNPFAPDPDDAKYLMDALMDTLVDENEDEAAKRKEREKDAQIALIAAQRGRMKWVRQALDDNNNNLEASLTSLMRDQARDDGALYAYRFMQGFMAARDAAAAQNAP